MSFLGPPCDVSRPFHVRDCAHMIRRRLWFVGVSTSGSRAIGLFPRWCAALGIDAELVPVDLPLGAPAEAHRRLVANLGADQEAVGAVVTTHKVALFEAAAERFASRDPSVDLFEEIACVTAGMEASRPTLSIHGARPGRCLRCFPGPSTRSALVLGAGGAGTAVAAALLMDRTSPWTVTLTDTAGDRLARAERILSALSVRNRAVLVPASGSEENDGALARRLRIARRQCDRDGEGRARISGVRKRVFPEHGLVWDLNYRGEPAVPRSGSGPGPPSGPSS